MDLIQKFLSENQRGNNLLHNLEHLEIHKNSKNNLTINAECKEKYLMNINKIFKTYSKNEAKDFICNLKNNMKKNELKIDFINIIIISTNISQFILKEQLITIKRNSNVFYFYLNYKLVTQKFLSHVLTKMLIINQQPASSFLGLGFNNLKQKKAEVSGKSAIYTSIQDLSESLKIHTKIIDF